MLSIFSCALYVFFGEISIHAICPFSDWVACFYDIELYELFIYFGCQPLIGHICKYFSHSGGYLYILLMVSFAVPKLLSFFFLNVFIYLFIACTGSLLLHMGFL